MTSYAGNRQSRQKIITHLWYDQEAVAAAEFYVAAFKDFADSSIGHTTKIMDTPSGDCDLVSFDLAGRGFMAISAGPLFKFNPSISFILNFDPARDANAREKLDKLWQRLSQDGTALMPLDSYPFSARYGWIQDKFGLSWQLLLAAPDSEPRPFITPSLLFTGAVAGKAEEAIAFYQSVFKGSERGQFTRYPAGMEPDREGTLMFADFMLEQQWFAAMDSAREHDFAFNEAVSFLVHCEDQAELDYYSSKLSADPNAEQCGWLKDKYGVSWQVSPRAIQAMMQQGSKDQVARLTQALLQMKRFDLAALEKAYQGE